MKGEGIVRSRLATIRALQSIMSSIKCNHVQSSAIKCNQVQSSAVDELIAPISRDLIDHDEDEDTTCRLRQLNFSGTCPGDMGALIRSRLASMPISHMSLWVEH